MVKGKPRVSVSQFIGYQVINITYCTASSQPHLSCKLHRSTPQYEQDKLKYKLKLQNNWEEDEVDIEPASEGKAMEVDL